MVTVVVALLLSTIVTGAFSAGASEPHDPPVSPQRAEDYGPVEVISHWHPNITINIVDDHTPWVKGSVPPPLDQCEAPSPSGSPCLHLPKLSTLPHPCLKTPLSSLSSSVCQGAHLTIPPWFWEA